jgi:hypothetical protein
MEEIEARNAPLYEQARKALATTKKVNNSDNELVTIQCQYYGYQVNGQGIPTPKNY